MGKYDELLAGIDLDYSNTVKWIRKFADSSKTKIPLLCEALRDEADKDGLKPSNDDIRDRIMKDCLRFWSKTTIHDAFPEWLLREIDYPKQEITVTTEGEQ